jgi:ParB family transcriptional regulator, chromosome partitioning protein
VRPVEGHYQIISGHHRTAAARRAGLAQIPAWVREMDETAAFMQLVLANAQGELSPLERGLHALAATEAGQKVRDYALQVGRSKSMVQVEVSAARVALSTQVDKTKLVSCAKHLAEIHAAPQHCWTALVERMIENDWTVEEAKRGIAFCARPVRYSSPLPGSRQR